MNYSASDHLCVRITVAKVHTYSFGKNKDELLRCSSIDELKKNGLTDDLPNRFSKSKLSVSFLFCLNPKSRDRDLDNMLEFYIDSLY